MLKKPLARLRDAQKRHEERYTALGLRFALADSIEFLNAAHWDAIAEQQSLFLSRAYLTAIERTAPANIEQRYALIYDGSKPVAIVACQIAELSGEQLLEQQKHDSKRIGLLRRVKQRMLVCGNLISSGLHGVGFADGVDTERGWRAVAEALYRIRRGDKLTGAINLTLIKDLKAEHCQQSDVLRRYSYRPIKTDPDMVLSFADGVQNYTDYLGMLTTKYRSRVKKIRQSLLDAGFTLTRWDAQTVAERDQELHALYLEVEQRAAVRLATIAPGYLAAMAAALNERFVCTTIQRDGKLAGFIVTLKDGELGIAYYVGIDYTLNDQHPVYLCLLQISIEDALAMGCRKLSMGRTALEPKANLGAKPVDSQVWLRHRVPVVNFTLRKFFPLLPYDEAPERSALKAETEATETA